MLLKLEDLQAWLLSTGALLRSCGNGLVLTAADCREMERLCRRAATIVGSVVDEQREAALASQRADVMAEAATGGPPPLPPEPAPRADRARIVAVPELGPTVFALIPAVARAPVVITQESDHA